MQGTRGRFADARSKLQHLVDLVNFDKNRRFGELQKRLQVKIKEAIDESYQVAKAKLKADRKELIAASKKRFAKEQQVIEKLQEANGFLHRMDELDFDSQDIMEECELLERDIAKIIGKTKMTKNWFEEARHIAKRAPQIGKGKYIPNTVTLGRIDWEVDELDIDTDDQSSDDDFEVEEKTGEDDFDEENRKSVILAKQEDGDSLIDSLISGVADLNPYRTPPSERTSVAGTSGAVLLESSSNSQMENAKRMRPYVDYRFHDDRADFELDQEAAGSRIQPDHSQENNDELSVFIDRIAKMKPVKNIFASSVRDIQKEASKQISPISTSDSFKSARSHRKNSYSKQKSYSYGRSTRGRPGSSLCETDRYQRHTQCGNENCRQRRVRQADGNRRRKRKSVHSEQRRQRQQRRGVHLQSRWKLHRHVASSRKRIQRRHQHHRNQQGQKQILPRQGQLQSLRFRRKRV